MVVFHPATDPLRTPQRDATIPLTMSLSLSPLVRFGTSTWTYEGWQGQVYKRQYARSTFTRECLGEYCQYQYEGEPLFRTVGNDSTFYRPPTANQLRHYLTQIPEDFQMCFKVWEEITIPHLCQACPLWDASWSAQSALLRR